MFGTGMKKMCTLKPITLEATTPAMPIKLHSGPEGSSSSLELSLTGMDLNTNFGNVVVEAKLGSIAQTAGTNFTVDAGTEIEVKNKNGNIKIDSTGFISMKGAQSDIHTLFKKLSMALQNMTFPTPAGPSSVATNMSEFTGFDAEIDKVFKK